MVETMQLLLFFVILFSTFVIFAFILRSEAKKSGYLRNRSTSMLEKAPHLTMKKGY
ncbi:hypothetical protein [Alkalihalobacillus sp. R86527]|uniref:hypothetical protein n=1 Tax=Alkalihalobacillus sp. R86527 TaxID=3093863 RepID=UPI00366C1247